MNVIPDTVGVALAVLVFFDFDTTTVDRAVIIACHLVVVLIVSVGILVCDLTVSEFVSVSLPSTGRIVVLWMHLDASTTCVAGCVTITASLYPSACTGAECRVIFVGTVLRFGVNLLDSTSIVARVIAMLRAFLNFTACLLVPLVPAVLIYVFADVSVRPI